MANNETSIIISAVDKTEGALKSVGANVGALEGQFNRLSGVVSGFAALAGVSAFAGIVKGAVDSAAGLHDMAQQTGASVESLSAMRGAAKLAGVDLEQVAGGLQKLSKNMLEASQGNGKAADVFKALGISVTDASGKMKSSDQVFLEFSKGLQNVSSGAERTAAAQAVLGKSGAQLLPMMNDLAVAGDLQAKVTAKQAAAADELQDNMIRLSTVGNAWKTTVAMEIVPAANAFVEALLEVSTTTDGTKKMAKDLASDGSIKEWAVNAATAVGFVVDSFDGASRVVKGIGYTIAAAAAQAASVAKGDFTGAMVIGREWLKDLDAIAQKEQFSDVLARRIAKIGQEAPPAAAGTTSLATALKGLADDGGKAAKAMEALRIDQMMRIHKEAAKELETMAKAQEDYVKALQAALDPLEQQARNLEREVQNYGLTESAIQATIVARMEEARAIAAANGAWPEHLNYLDQEIEMRKRIGSASSQKEFLDANKKAAEQSAKEWEKFSDDINRALTDALMRGFESGKSFGENFVDSLKNSLKTAALKIVVNYVTNGAGQLVGTVGNAAINGVLGTSSTNGGSGTNYLGMASNANSLYNVVDGTYLNTATGLYNDYIAGTTIGGYTAGYIGAGGSGITGSMFAGSNVLGTTSAGTLAGGGGSIGGGALGGGITSTGGTTGITGTVGGYGSALATETGGAAITTAAPASSSTGMGAYVWPLAAIVGMFMSSEAWKAGIKWNGDYSPGKNLKESGLHGAIHDGQYKSAEFFFGKDHADGQFFQTVTFAALSQSLSKMIWGDTKATGISSLKGAFVENGDGNSFVGQSGQEFRKAGGWFGSASTNVEWQNVGADFQDGMSDLYKGVRKYLLLAGAAFDDFSLADKIKGFVSLVDVKNANNIQGVQEALANQIMQGLGELMFPSVGALQKTVTKNGMAVAESWSEIFGRVMQEVAATGNIFDLLGKNIFDVFGTGNADRVLKLSDSFVQLFGSIDGMNQSIGAYYGNFYTAAEKTDFAWEKMEQAFAGIGQTMPTTRQGFRDLADSLDLSTSAGSATFHALMGLQAGFAALTPSIEDAAKAAADAAAALIANAKAQRDSLLEKFITPEQSISAAQTKVTATFEELKIKVPVDGSAFYDLAKGVDVSTEAGRKLIEALSGVADAFVLTQDAAAKYAAEQAEKLGQVTSARTGILNQIFESQMVDMTSAAQAAALKLKEGSLWELLEGGDVSVVDELSATLLKRISLESEAAKAAADAAAGLVQTMKAARDYAVDMHNQVLSLKAGDLSSLGYLEQLGASETLWQETLAKAQSGDTKAQSSLSGVAREYLQEARGYYGANADYASRFSAVTGALDAFSFDAPTDSQIIKQEDFANNLKLSVNQGGEQVEQLKKIDAVLAKQQATFDAQIVQNAAIAEATIARLQGIIDQVTTLNGNLSKAALV